MSYLVSMLIGERGANHGVELNMGLVEHSACCVAAMDVKLGRQTDIQVLEGNGLNVAMEPGCGCVRACPPPPTANRNRHISLKHSQREMDLGFSLNVYGFPRECAAARTGRFMPTCKKTEDLNCCGGA